MRKSNRPQLQMSGYGVSSNSGTNENSGHGIPIPAPLQMNDINSNQISSSLPNGISQSAPSNFHENPFTVKSPFHEQAMMMNSSGNNGVTINPSLLQQQQSSISAEDLSSSDLMLTEHLFPLTIGNNEQDFLKGFGDGVTMENSSSSLGMANSSSSLLPNEKQHEFYDFAHNGHATTSIDPSTISASFPDTSTNAGSSSPILFATTPTESMNTAQYYGHPKNTQQGLSQSYQNSSANNSQRFIINRPRRAISSASSSTFETDGYSHADSPANSFPGTKIPNPENSRVSAIVDSEKQEKRRRRRESHNAVERRRRDLINEKIRELSQIVPDLIHDDKLNKGVILTKSVDHILQLQAENAQLKSELQRFLNQHQH